MKIAIPREVMQGEGRVALVPGDCDSLVKAGHIVLLQAGAGVDSGYSDGDYQQRGVELMPDASALYGNAELVVKVKQPLSQDLLHLRADHTLFSFLHLAADRDLVKALCDIGLTAIPFESVTEAQQGFPLLAPMSAIAGRLAVIRGARLLFSLSGGRGVLLGGVEGADAGRVVVLGAGVAGSHAAQTALALGAEVHVIDVNIQRLQLLSAQYPKLDTHVSEPDMIARLCQDADLVVGAVMLAGRRAPVVLTTEMIKAMPSGSVIVDIAIDQGGCVENIRLTKADELAYTLDAVIHSAVPNMPGAVPRTASQALSAAIAPYVARLAAGQAAQDEVLKAATAIHNGQIIDSVLADEMNNQAIAG